VARTASRTHTYIHPHRRKVVYIFCTARFRIEKSDYNDGFYYVYVGEEKNSDDPCVAEIMKYDKKFEVTFPFLGKKGKSFRTLKAAVRAAIKKL